MPCSEAQLQVLKSNHGEVDMMLFWEQSSSVVVTEVLREFMVKSERLCFLMLVISSAFCFCSHENADAGFKDWASNIGRGIGKGVGKVKKIRFGAQEEDVASAVAEAQAPKLIYANNRYGSEEPVPLKWAIGLPDEIDGLVWVGTTLKKIPYTESEFNDLRYKMVSGQVKILRQEHIVKKRAQMEKEEGLGGVEDMLDSFLDEGGAEEEEEEDEDVEALLVDFDEKEVRRKVLERLVIPQFHSEVIQAIFFQAPNNDLYCIDAETGLTLWVTTLSSQLLHRPYETEDRLYAVLLGRLVGLDKKSGYPSVMTVLDRVPYPNLFVEDDNLYLASYDLRLFRYPVGEQYSVWVSKMRGEPAGGVYGDTESLYVPLLSGELLCYSFRGSEKWTFINKGLSDEKIYFEKKLNALYKQIEKEKSDSRRQEREEDAMKIHRVMTSVKKLEAQKKALTNRTRGRFMSPPVIEGDDLYVSSTDFNVYRLNKHSGIPSWAYNCGVEAWETPYVGKDYVWLKDSHSRLHRINIKTGEGEIMIRDVKDIQAVHEDLIFYVKGGALKVNTKTSTGSIKGLGEYKNIVSPDGSLMVVYGPRAKTIQVYDTSIIR
ncbi:MAG: PQQ-binding-like beta-propeller repeat protein [Planctomycetes bacterium]|nr:PQQ-binding-like beta-propeller repeat protein [Planctomycetota bacterium]